MASNRGRAARRLERDQAGADTLLPASPLAQLFAELWREGPELQAEPAGPDHLVYRWARKGVGQATVRVALDNHAARNIVSQCRTDSHIAVEMEATLVTALEVDGVEDGFDIRDILDMTRGPTWRWHPERHSPHIRDGRDLLGCDWHIALDGDTGQTVLVDWRPLAVIEPGRVRHRCTVSLYPPFRAALTSQMAPVPPATFLLPIPGHTNPEGSVMSLAHNARGRIAAARAPYDAANNYAATKGWNAPPGTIVPIGGRRLAELAGINLDRVAKRGRLAAWFDGLVRLLPARARTTAIASPVFDTRLGVEAPSQPPVPARAGPARASPAFA